MSTTETLYTGFGKIEYTPDFPVGLAGYGGDLNRAHTEVVSPVYITCVSVKQADTTVLLYTVDTCGLYLSHIRRFRTAIEAATGVPETNIFFGATHGHNCPSMAPESQAGVPETLNIMEKAAIEAAKTALSDLAETTIFAAKPIIPGMNFTRHYRIADGRRRTTTDGVNKKYPIVGHLGFNDPQMMLTKFTRKDRKDIVLMNWQAHPDDARKIGFNCIAAGFVAPVRDTLETLSGCHVAYFTGASGNQVRDSLLPELAHGLTYDEYGKKLAQMAFASFDQLRPVENTGIRFQRKMLEVNVNHTEDHKLQEAEEILQAASEGDNEKVSQLCREYGFFTTLHAKGVRLRASMDRTNNLELNALRIGRIGFAFNTCETFSDQGLNIKNYSPYDYTFVVTGNRSYLASSPAFEYKAYEARGGSGYYEKGTAEKVAENLVEMLQDIF